MAKMKSFCVEVEVVHRTMVFVDARKAGGAEEKLYTEEGWREARRYAPDGEMLPMWAPKKDDERFRVVSVREVGS